MYNKPRTTAAPSGHANQYPNMSTAQYHQNFQPWNPMLMNQRFPMNVPLRPPAPVVRPYLHIDSYYPVVPTAVLSTAPPVYPAAIDSEDVLYITPQENADLKVLYEMLAQPHLDPRDIYVALPKTLFPPARTLNIDPNDIINEFCRIKKMEYDWILDLEFGINFSRKKESPHYLLPRYDVKYHSIQCDRAPETIHPSFGQCSERFQRALLSYYDQIVAAWYRGYIITAQDKSIENFQSWIQPPMQNYGMCWP